MEKIIYMPLEIKSRDFYSRLLLSLNLCLKYKFKIFFGHRGHVNYFAQNHIPGFYYGLATIRNFEQMYKNIKKNGNLIGISDEEGLLTYKNASYKNLKVSKKNLQLSDCVFTWGKKNYDILKKISKKKNIFITGNPRLDLINKTNKKVYRKQVSSIKKKYKKFILVCSTFSYINYFDKKIRFIDLLKKRKFFSNLKDISKWKNYEKVKKKTLDELLKFIKLLSNEQKKIKIVIRCHPSENNKIYKELSMKYRNVFFDDKFSVHPWLICCEKLINHYCTTTFEALKLNKEVFSLKPYKTSEMENNDFFKITTVAKNHLDLFTKLRSKNVNIAQQKLLSSYALNFKNDINSCDIISRKINETFENHKKKFEYKNKINFKKYFLKIKISKIKNFLRFDSSKFYSSHKIKEISKKEIQQFVSNFKIYDKKISVKKLEKNFFILTSV